MNRLTIKRKNNLDQKSTPKSCHTKSHYETMISYHITYLNKSRIPMKSSESLMTPFLSSSISLNARSQALREIVESVKSLSKIMVLLLMFLLYVPVITVHAP